MSDTLQEQLVLIKSSRESLTEVSMSGEGSRVQSSTSMRIEM